MSVDTSGSSDEDKPIFRPLTRDSLAQIQARIDSEHAKKKELLRKRAEGEVSVELGSVLAVRLIRLSQKEIQV